MALQFSPGTSLRNLTLYQDTSSKLVLPSLRPCYPSLANSGSPHIAVCSRRRRRRRQQQLRFVPVFAGVEEAELRVENEDKIISDNGRIDPNAEDLEYVAEIKRVLKLLKKNRDMLFNEIKLTIMIEDPRDAERKRLLGIDDNDVTRDDLVDALEDINEGKIPENKIALRMLAEEMIQWPNLEVEASKSNKSKSRYAKATDTGIDPKVAARRLNIDWDTAAEIEDDKDEDEVEVPAAVGYGALYIVTALPVIIGVSVVLILFYNSLQ